MTDALTYFHRQRAPLCVVLYIVAADLFVGAWFVQGIPVVEFVMPVLGVALLVLGMSFHHLTVADEVNRLAVRFGPLPLFHTAVFYDDIESVETGRTTILDGWGIHLSVRGGWVWNLWGFDCVVIRHRRGTLRVGTDDPQGLAAFLRARVGVSAAG